jgi:hypothetical protein
MSSLKNKNFILKDLVNEASVLREVRLYGCEEQPGKLYGYNPFNEKCVDITDYEGPEAPRDYGKKDIPKPGIPGKGKAAVDTDDSSIVDFLTDMYLSGMDAKEIMECVSENPGFSFLGALFGRPMVKFLPNLAYKGAKGTYNLFTDRGMLSAAADEYINMRQKQVNKDMKLFQRLARSAGTFLAELPKNTYLKLKGVAGGIVALAAGLGAVGFGALKMVPEEIRPFNGFIKSIESNTYGEKSYENWKCFGAAAVAMVLSGIILKGGAKGLQATMKATGNSSVWVMSALKNKLFRQSIEKAVKNIDSKQLTIFKFLQGSGKLPSEARVFLDKSSDVAKLSVSGLGDKIIKLPVEEVPDALKRYAVNGEIVLNPKQLSSDLENMSKSIMKTVNDSAIENVGKIKNTDFYTRVKAFQKAVNKFGGSASRARANILSDASKALSELLPNLEKSLQSFEAANKQIIKNELSIKRLMKSFNKSGVSDLDFKKLKNKVIENDTEDIQTIINSVLPGINKNPKLNERIVDHFELVRGNANLQKGLITDLEFVRKSILGDEKMMRKIFPEDKTTIHDTAAWLATPEGKKYEQLWAGMGSRRERALNAISKVGTGAVAGLREAVDTLFTDSIFLMAPLAAGTLGKTTLDTLDSIKENAFININEVTQMSKKDIKQLVAEVLNENSGMGYGKYPYDIGNSDDQPAEDYIEEWKALAVSLVKDESRDTAVAIAKILVKDLELFEDVLDLAGQNQSVGSEILRKIKEAKEN